MNSIIYLDLPQNSKFVHFINFLKNFKLLKILYHPVPILKAKLKRLLKCNGKMFLRLHTETKLRKFLNEIIRLQKYRYIAVLRG